MECLWRWGRVVDGEIGGAVAGLRVPGCVAVAVAAVLFLGFRLEPGAGAAAAKVAAAI
jgi:hypothetical protein